MNSSLNNTQDNRLMPDRRVIYAYGNILRLEDSRGQRFEIIFVTDEDLRPDQRIHVRGEILGV